MSLNVVWTNRFKKDYKLAMKRGLAMEELDRAIRLLAREGKLPERYLDHPLGGDWKGFRECHIQPDWLLICAIENNILVLTLARTGTHSDLFGK